MGWGAPAGGGGLIFAKRKAEKNLIFRFFLLIWGILKMVCIPRTDFCDRNNLGTCKFLGFVWYVPCSTSTLCRASLPHYEPCCISVLCALLLFVPCSSPAFCPTCVLDPRFDLRWIVIHDQFFADFTVEVLKERYYWSSLALLKARSVTDEDRQNVKQHPIMLTMYQKDQETQRKRHLDLLWARTREEEQEEMELRRQMKQIEQVALRHLAQLEDALVSITNAHFFLPLALLMRL